MSIDERWLSVAFLIMAVSIMIASALNLVSQELLVSIALGVFSAFIAVELVRTNEIKALKRVVVRFRSDLNSFLANSGRIFALDPSSFEDYVQAWGDYEGDMFALNPTFEESQTIQNVYKLVIERVHATRYNNPGFNKAHYLFFTGDNAGQHQFDLFKDLLRKIEKRAPEIRKKIVVKQTTREAPRCEFYVANKAGERYFVLQYRGMPLEERMGVPNRVFAGWDSRMYDKLHEVFDREWAKIDNIVVSNRELFGQP